MSTHGVRAEWEQVPDEVRSAIGEALGSPVVEAVNQAGGFSPGVAARSQLADGRRCFIKAVSPTQNPETPNVHRREANVMAQLPPGLPVPELLHVLDDGTWIVLVFDEVEGTMPNLPWSLDDLDRAFEALDRLADSCTRSPVPDLPLFEETHAADFDRFAQLAAADGAATIEGGMLTGPLDDWTERHLHRLADIEAGWREASAGKTLVHTDVRADNLLIDRDGAFWVVDWPHACIGAGWSDKLFMLPSVGLGDGPSPSAVEAALDPFAGVDSGAVDALLVALLGYFTFMSLQPSSPGLPTLRGFQRDQAEVSRRWISDRLGLD